jgi:septal ring factor EnvC (AmiA/AmiB activator)
MDGQKNMMGMFPNMELRRLKATHARNEKAVTVAKEMIRQEESGRKPMTNELTELRKEIWRSKRDAEEARMNLRRVVLAASSAPPPGPVEVSDDGRFFKLPVYVSSSALQEYSEVQAAEIARLEAAIAQQDELVEARRKEVEAQEAQVVFVARCLQSMRRKEMQVLPHPAGDVISHWPPVEPPEFVGKDKLNAGAEEAEALPEEAQAVTIDSA